MRRMFASGVVFAVLVGASITLRAQPQPEKPLAFEVASIKVNATADGIRRINVSPSGRVSLTRISLRDLLWLAYSTTSIQEPDQVIGGPGWVTTDRFDIEAKADSPLQDEPGSSVRDRFNSMLKSLIKDRFQARVHVEKRETQVYALRLANRDGTLGPAIHPTTHDCPKDADCGVRNRGGFVVATGVTMDDIAHAFSSLRMVDGPTQNATGLDGRFDFQLRYTPPVPSSPDQIDPRPNTDFIGSFLTDFQDQLGLRLQREKGILEFVVIDHVEQPTPD